MKRWKRGVIVLACLFAVIALWLGLRGRNEDLAWSYVRLIKSSNNAEERRVAAAALGNLGLPWTVPYLIQGIDGSNDVWKLCVLFGRMKGSVEGQRAPLGSRVFVDPCARAVLRIGQEGARELPSTLFLLKDAQKGWAILLAAQVGIDEGSVDVLEDVALGKCEDDILPEIACYALETMGSGGVQPLVEIVERLEEDSDVESSWSRLHDVEATYGRVFTAALGAAFRAQLGVLSESTEHAATLARALRIPTGEWAFAVKLMGSCAVQAKDRVLLLTPGARARSFDPIIVVTDRDFRLRSWKRIPGVLGWAVVHGHIDENKSIVELRFVRRASKRGILGKTVEVEVSDLRG